MNSPIQPAVQQALSSSAQETRPSTTNIRTYAHSEECFDAVWTALQSARLISDKWLIGGIDYGNWRDSVADLTDKHLVEGRELAVNHQGFFQLGHFRHYCIQGHNARVEQERNRRKSQERTLRLKDASRLGNKRFQELHKVTMAMLEETGEGPITRATKDRRLTKHVVQGKSADEIIAFCKALYQPR